MKRRAIVGVVVLASLLAACGGGSSSSSGGRRTPSTTAAPGPDDPAYAGRGPYVVSYATISTADRQISVFYPGRPGSQHDQRHATYDIRAANRDPSLPPLKPSSSQEVQLPAYRDLPPADGTFPAVMFGHGTEAVPLSTAHLDAALAAWGFVVIAPDIVERDTYAVATDNSSVDDMSDAVIMHTALKKVEQDPVLGPMVDTAHVAAVGHGQGGAAALAALALPDVEVAVTWASARPKSAVTKKPVMLIGAQHDLVSGTVVQNHIYDGLTGPRSLVVIRNGAGYATFLDSCEEVQDTGLLIPGTDVLPKRGKISPMALAQNGCYPGEIEPMAVWPAVQHFTVAYLRSVFAIDDPPVGLGDGITKAFPRVNLTYKHEP